MTESDKQILRRLTVAFAMVTAFSAMQLMPALADTEKESKGDKADVTASKSSKDKPTDKSAASKAESSKGKSTDKSTASKAETTKSKSTDKSAASKTESSKSKPTDKSAASKAESSKGNPTDKSASKTESSKSKSTDKSAASKTETSKGKSTDKPAQATKSIAAASQNLTGTWNIKFKESPDTKTHIMAVKVTQKGNTLSATGVDQYGDVVLNGLVSPPNKLSFKRTYKGTQVNPAAQYEGIVIPATPLTPTTAKGTWSAQPFADKTLKPKASSNSGDWEANIFSGPAINK